MTDSKIALTRVAADGPDFDFQKIRKRQLPVILTGATAAWAAREKWSFDYFREVLGHLEYKAEVNLPLDVPISYSLEDFQKNVLLGDFIEMIVNSKSDRASYITNKSIDRFPGIENDVNFEQLLGFPVSQELTRLWIGTANTKSSLHFDPYENVLCQMIGAKKVYLVDPKSTSNIYQYSSNIDKSHVDVEDPDFDAYPKFQNVNVYEGVLAAGECLFIPTVWWHSARSLSTSISVNCFFGERIGEKELLPLMWAGGPRLIGAFIRDFTWNGLFRRPYKKRLYAAEPFGVWFYNQIRDSLSRRARRILGR